jgi:hypothetical protein
MSAANSPRRPKSRPELHLAGVPGRDFGEGRRNRLTAAAHALQYAAGGVVLASQASALFRETAEAIYAFAAREPWKKYDADGLFAIRRPPSPGILFASIMGQSGIEHGLVVTRGPNAYRDMLAIHGRAGADPEALRNEVTMLGFAMDPYRRLPPESQRFVRKAGLRLGANDLAPFFVLKEPGLRARGLRPDDVEAILFVLRILAKADGLGLEPREIGEEAGTLTLTATGDAADPDLAAEYVDYSERRAAPPSARFAVPDDVKDLPRRNARWAFGFPSVPFVIGTDRRSVRFALVVDEASGIVLSVSAVMGNNYEEAADVLFNAMRGQNWEKRPGIPDEIVIADAVLFDRLSSALTGLGVSRVSAPSTPALSEAIEALRNDFPRWSRRQH